MPITVRTIQDQDAVDIAVSKLAPATDETIAAAYSAIVSRKYTLVSGTKLIIGSGACFRIL